MEERREDGRERTREDIRRRDRTRRRRSVLEIRGEKDEKGRVVKKRDNGRVGRM